MFSNAQNLKFGNHPEENEQTWKFIFDHEPATEYTDMGKVQQVLERRMAELTDNKGISKTPIIVRIRSPNVIPLTVIDLPGIVKVRLVHVYLHMLYHFM